jgi:hypothetical protein
VHDVRNEGKGEASVTTATATTTPNPIDDFCLFDLQGQEVTGIPRWRAYSFRGMDPSSTLLKGAVCDVVYKSGPRKGRINWTKRDLSTEREIALSQEQVDAFGRAWEAKTGLCQRCWKTPGKVFAGWSKEKGSWSKPCPRCHATGKALESEAKGATP